MLGYKATTAIATKKGTNRESPVRVVTQPEKAEVEEVQPLKRARSEPRSTPIVLSTEYAFSFYRVKIVPSELSSLS